ncbi:MAG: hypothetical protein IJZ77_06240 [Bacilli bacterium]|nr:hypothetical protein [Bacilli bacterium]MBQ8424595.1 hypothetical protein [Clostridia bacterium]
MDKKNITLTIVNVALIIVTAFMGLMSLVWAYYKTLGRDKIPSAVTSTYATYIVDPHTNEEVPVIEANYYSNRNGTGYEVIELLFNCYSGISKQAVYSRGFQIVWDTKGNIIPYQFESEKSNVYQYNRYDGVSFETGHRYEWGDKMIIDIDGTTYAVALDGTYSVTTKGFSPSKSFKNVWKASFTDWGMFKEDKYWNKYSTTTYNYTFEDLLNKMKNIIKSYSNGTGDSVIPLIDLGDFLHIYPIDEDGKISGTALGKNTLQNSYFTMAVHYDNRGMVWAEQSIFSSVAGDSQFNISGISSSVDYWKATTCYEINEKDFTKRYVTAEGGYYYSLSAEKIADLKNFTDISIIVTFDISNLLENVIGFDHYALYGLKIDSLTITSDVSQNFKLLTSSLKDTGISNINTKNVTIIDVNSGVEL